MQGIITNGSIILYHCYVAIYIYWMLFKWTIYTKSMSDSEVYTYIYTHTNLSEPLRPELAVGGGELLFPDMSLRSVLLEVLYEPRL